MSKINEKKRKEMLRWRWQDVKKKPEGRDSTEKELIDNDMAWEKN